MTGVELEEKLSKLNLEAVMGVFIIDTPEGYHYDGYTVNFEEDFYQVHKEIIDDFVKKLCSYERQWIKNLYFISYPFTINHFYLLRDNETIHGINLHNHELSKEEFEILKQSKNLEEIDSSSVCQELSECYDKRLGAIMKRDVTNYKNVKDVIYDENLNFYEELTEEQVLTICSLLEKRKVKGNLSFSNMNNGCLIKRIIDKFESIQTEEDSTISIEMENRELFDYKAFNDLEQNARIEVITSTDAPVDMNMFIQVEEKLVEITKEYKEQEDKLSPFEKLLWLYNTVETYRKYKKEEKEEDWEMSRYLHKLLFSEYLVCAGFAHLLAELSQRASLNVFENCAIVHCENKSSITSDDYNHMNNLAFIEDEKYGIKGLYLLDATHDNHQYEDLFVLNHFLVTPEEYDKHIMKIYAAGYSLLTVKGKEQFLEILKNDNVSLSSLIRILSLYYKDHDFFKVGFNSSDDSFPYYLERAESLYELAQGITIEKIPQEKIERAFTHIEKIKNPAITVEELAEKLNTTFALYQERNAKIYHWQKGKENSKKRAN